MRDLPPKPARSGGPQGARQHEGVHRRRRCDRRLHRLPAGAGRPAQVSALARGATLQALQQHGWRLRQDGSCCCRCRPGPPSAAALGVQDLVVIAVKGPALPALAPTLAPLIGPHTLLLPAMNGVPWWFGQGVPALGDAPLHSVDPGGGIAAALPGDQVIGCVVHASTAQPEPGLVQHQRWARADRRRAARRPQRRAQAVADAAGSTPASSSRMPTTCATTSGTSCGAT
jgi:ketopantoate reductase